MEFEVNKMKMKKIIFINFAVMLAFSACTTVQQDIVISSVQKNEIKEIDNFEFRLVYLDAEHCAAKNTSPSDVAAQNAACEKLIADISAVQKNDSLVLSAQARLTALKGRIYFIQNKLQQAKECYFLAEEKYKGDIQNFILAHRLSIISDLTSRVISASDKPLILIEQALDAYAFKNYMTAVAKFDEAFISSQSFYRDAYKPIRDDAWNKRAVNDMGSENSEIAALLEKPELTVGQMMMIAQSHEKIIDYYTAGNRYTESSLFRKLSQSGLLTPAAKTAAPQKIYPYTKLTRSMQARFLWNIFCEQRNNTSLKTKYSESYQSMNAESPLRDVPVQNEDFDAILGCVEFDIMSLTDGIQFEPNNPVSGIDFEKSIKKLENEFRR